MPRITELPEVTQADIASLLTCVDEADTTTKKVTFDNFFRSRGVFYVADAVAVTVAADAEANAVAINAAISAASAAGGGTVQLSKGVYEVKDDAAGTKGYAIEMASNVRLVGHSGGTTIKMWTGETREHSIIENVIAGIDNCEIAHLTFDGSRDRMPDMLWGVREDEGIDLKSPKKCWIHHCYLFDIPSDAIDLDSSEDCWITDCLVIDCGGGAVHGSGPRTIISRINSQNCGIYRLQSATQSVRDTTSAIYWALGDFSIISDCTSKNDVHGVLIDQCDRSTVTGCTAENPGDGVAQPTWPDGYSGGGCGVIIRDCLTCAVVACVSQIRNLDNSYGFWISDNNLRCTVVGCTTIVGKVGYLVEGGATAAENTIMGCVSGAPNQNGIKLSGIGSQTVLANNLVFGSVDALRIEQGTSDVSVTGNYLRNASNSGVYVIGPSDDVTINGNRVDNCNQGVRLRDIGGAPTNCVVMGNNLRNNATPFAETDGTGHVIINNVGYNPIGVSSITVGGSPYTYTAGFGRETVYIYGGTVSDVAKSGTTIATDTGVSVELAPGESVTVTYSTIPTMIKDEH